MADVEGCSDASPSRPSSSWKEGIIISKPHDALAASAYAQFALQQPLTLEQLAAAADEMTFPLATTQTPEWFSAAGSPGSSLVDTAPELSVGASGAASADGSEEKLDLVRMYAPELGQEVPRAAPPTPPAARTPDVDPEPETDTPQDDALGMLRELDNLDT